MLLSPLRYINPISGNRGGSASFNLTSALHEWNYQNATDAGTTVTMPDTGSIGTLPISNPGAASEPTLQIDGIQFDGVSEYLINNVSNFRSSDSTGVLHLVIKTDSATGTYGVWGSNDSTNNNYGFKIFDLSGNFDFIIGTTAGNRWRIQYPLSRNTVYIISLLSDGSTYKLIVNGINVSYTTAESGAIGDGAWFNSCNVSRSNISFGALIKPSINYGKFLGKYNCYSPYVDLSTAIAENNEIKEGLNL